MKKTAIAFAAALLLSLTACSANGTANTTPTPEGSSANADVASAEANNTVSGEVYEVIGNLITLKLIETPNIISGNGFQGAGFDMSDEDTQARMKEILGDDYKEGMTQEEMQAVLRERMSSGEGGMAQIREGAGGGEMPQGMPQVIGGGETGATFERSQGGSGTPRAARELNYTGEEREVIIPIGTPIVTMSRGESGMEEKEVSLDSIKTGDIMTVTYSDDGAKVTKIVISQNGMVYQTQPANP